MTDTPGRRPVVPPDDLERFLADLNPAQREAATATRGPVAILAGAGTGKTTTITRRVACQVAGGEFRADQLLAVTFTEKAAGELKARLRALGIDGVEARTFHAAALGQLARLWPAHTGMPLGDVLDAKGPLISSPANALPPPHRFVPRRDLATEIEWAKNRMVEPGGYLDEVAASGHAPPIPAELMARVFDGYERRKRAAGRLDFEDMLEMGVRLFDEHPDAAGEIHARYAAFTVDEFQDVNPLQAALLDRWLGGRDELCVVGDDYQTIYGFTGASPEYLLRFGERFPGARVVRLEQNYRSTPQILSVANRLAGSMGGFRKSLRPTRPAGPSPVIAAVPGEAAETAAVVQEIRRLHRSEGLALEEMAILYRINARSEPYEEAFAAARIPYQVRDGAFLRRPGPRAALHRLRGMGGDVVGAVERVTSSLGFDPSPRAEFESAEEVTRQADLARLGALAEEFARARPDGDVPGFLAELARRFSPEQAGRGVNLMTYHRAKGLEFDAVFLPRLIDGELPFRSGRNRAPLDEERRLLYVGITRARRHLMITWPAEAPTGRGARAGRSPFIDEILGPEPPRGRRAVGVATTQGSRAPAGTPTPPRPSDRLFDALRRWRRERAARDGVPAYVVLHDSTLREIVSRRPRTVSDLRGIPGIGPAKLERYAAEVLDVLAE